MSGVYDIHPLSFGDSLFLYFEREGQPINVASVTLFEGDIPLDVCRDFIESKLPMIPRYRQHLVVSPLNLIKPSWHYDPTFDIRNHVREITLKRGTEAELKSVAAKILSTHLDRRRPLWDFTLLRGLKGNRTGAVVRIHHCLADGISGVGIMNVLMDPSPACPPLVKEKHSHQSPPAQTPGMSLLEGLMTAALQAADRMITIETDLLRFAEFLALGEQPQNGSNNAANGAELRDSAAGEFTKLLPELGRPSERLPFNAVCYGPQRFEWTEIPLPAMKAVKNACGTTLNDVALSTVTAAIRDYVAMHGTELAGRTVRIVVPVNVRGNGSVSELGNRITFLPVDLPLDIRDARELLAAVHTAMLRLKAARIGELIGLVGTLVTSIPSPLQAILGPIVSQMPLSFLCNTICTNVPGPQVPLYLLGHKLLACYPYVPIGGEMGMNCAIITYDGKAFFGFTGDVNVIPDIEHLPKLLKRNFAELQKASVEPSARRRRSQARTKNKTGAVSSTAENLVAEADSAASGTTAAGDEANSREVSGAVAAA